MKRTVIYLVSAAFLGALILSSCSSNKPSFQKPRNGGKRVNSSGSMGKGAK